MIVILSKIAKNCLQSWKGLPMPSTGVYVICPVPNGFSVLMLSKNTDENHAMNADEIREELAKRGISVMRKVIADDISVLNEYGYEVLSYKKKYYYYYVVSRPIETAEVVMLADAVNASKLPATQKKALVERLSSFLCSHQAESVSKHIISFEKSRKGSSSLIYNVDSIERAINENKKISFLYFDYDDKHKKVYRKDGKRYVVSPAYMVWNKDNYYLLCFSNGYADLVTYRLDKMDDVKVDETEREPHPEYEKFNTDEYRKQVFSMFGGELCNVMLSFEPSILSDMFDRFGDDIRIRKVDENTYSVDVSVQVSKTLFAWIVGTQGKVKIRSPRKVLDEFDTSKFKDFCPEHKLHDLRHTFATRCIESGVSMKVVQTWLGHARLDTTASIYTHLLPDFIQSESEKIKIL